MSIFAMNYLNDISEYDQSVVNFNEKEVIALRRKSQEARTLNRITRDQKFVKLKAQYALNCISSAQNKLIEDVIVQQSRQKGGLSSQFIQLYQYKFNKKSKMEDFNHNCSDQDENPVKNKDFIKEEALDPKEEIYLRIIKRRDDKLKKVQKKYYFFGNSGI